MVAFNNNKQETQEIKQYIKPHKVNKLSDPKEKVEPRKENRTLPIRGQS
jgi:hypothetical protein